MANTETVKKDESGGLRKSLSTQKNKHKIKKMSTPSVKISVNDFRKLSKSKIGSNESKGYLTPKSNEDLRGSTSCLLIKGLPLNVKIRKLKKDQIIMPKCINLSKKDGQRSALITFKSEGDCAESFDALKGYLYEGRETVVTFVRPRSVVDRKNIPSPSCLDFLLDVGNIPFYYTLEHLKSIFPKADSIIQRCRHDNSFKGSCILAFSSKEDCDEAMSICRKKLVEGRELTCSQAAAESCKALLQELASFSAVSKGDRDGLQIKLFNLPYSVTKDELKKKFPQARHIFLPTTKQGEPTGIGILTFKTKVMCQLALEKAKKTQLQGRRLRAEINTLKAKSKPLNDKGRAKFNKDKSTKHRHRKSKSRRPLENSKFSLDCSAAD